MKASQTFYVHLELQPIADRTAAEFEARTALDDLESEIRKWLGGAYNDSGPAEAGPLRPTG